MLSEKIKKLRVEKGYTQEDVATFLGVAPQTVYKYEKGINEPDVATISKLADFFDVSVDYLLGRDTINEPIEIAASMKDKADLSRMSEKDKEYILGLIDSLSKDE